MNDIPDIITKEKRIGIASDHGGFELKQFILLSLRDEGYSVQDFGNKTYQSADDYPDYVIPLAQALNAKQIDRAIAICGSGVGASVAANKIPGVRACLINDTFSAHQGVEDDDMNMICLGGRVVGHAMAMELVNTFLTASFTGAERHIRRLNKIKAYEKFYNVNSLKSNV